MSGPFKMKGSPMLRNFGIGASPMKQEPKFDPHTGSVIKEESQKLKEPPKGKRPPNVKKKKLPTFRKGDVSIPQYSKSGEKRYNIEGE